MRQALEMARVVQMSTLPASMPTRRRLRGVRHVPAGRPDRRRHLRPRADRRRACWSCSATRPATASRPALRSRRCRRCCAWRSAWAPTSTPRSCRSTTGSPRRSPTTASSPRSSGCSTRRRTGCASTAAGQGPILHFRAATGAFERHKPTSFPLGAMPLAALARRRSTLELAPGDILVLLSDGFYEQHDAAGEQFGEQRVEALVRAHHGERRRGAARGDPGGGRRPRGRRAAGGRHDRGDPASSAAARGESRAFARSFASIDGDGGLHAPTRSSASASTASLLPTVDFVVEELFTNMVKYATGRARATCGSTWPRSTAASR